MELFKTDSVWRLKQYIRGFLRKARSGNKAWDARDVVNVSELRDENIRKRLSCYEASCPDVRLLSLSCCPFSSSGSLSRESSSG